VVVASARAFNEEVLAIFPEVRRVTGDIPDRVRAFLEQALETTHAPAGSVMLAASGVDAMLKEKGFKTGSLYARIEEAAAAHAITADMSKWAHEVRLDANDQRHADEAATLPTVEEAKRSVDFALALAEILFVLPGRVKRGIDAAKPK
jgi:hypothetical protein